VAAGGGVIRWRGRDYEVSGPEMIDGDEALPSFDPVQRLFLRLAGIDGYVRVHDAAIVTRERVVGPDTMARTPVRLTADGFCRQTP